MIPAEAFGGPDTRVLEFPNYVRIVRNLHNQII